MTYFFRPLAVLAAALAASPAAFAAEGTRVQVRGEIIDTWCYYSGVMGGPESVVGTAHHTCALWCSAGGIPVGLLAEDGTVYMVLKIEGDDGNAGGDTQLSLASHEITADGIHYERDGLNYLVVEEVVTDHGITNVNHEDFGAIPGFAIPDPSK
ncbi:hypothetical protein [Litoreibacter roseus]|uniref:Uncharacterized protein n=1 Tax=Litoreibacter roseus TaxID=2601869 RepID=A0A6N6JD69_9RHOB|nr:hypothetical protein [Litoreibacter roseus]GFE63927.1 hypothetical protein KIN_10010 [Litoreibacter roseus]